jgi:nitrate ABC transporter ATP-binding subunit
VTEPNDRYLELWNVAKDFHGPTGNVRVVENFSLNVARGEFVSLIGHSGCGKSTILSIVAGLLEETTGGVILDGRQIDGAGPDRGVVFQAPSLLPWMTALENVVLGIEQVQPRTPARLRREAAAEMLGRVGLADSIDKYPDEMSQGMRQRVGLARAFALHPKILLLDEPFGMLDSLTRYELQDVLTDLLNADGRTAVMVTHDVDEALYLSDRVVMMTNGPHARVGDILDVPFARPRRRQEVMDAPEYYVLRERLVGFLEGQAHGPPKKTTDVEPAAPAAVFRSEPVPVAGESLVSCCAAS